MIVITQEITNEEIRFHCGMKLITLHIRALLYDWYSVPARKKRETCSCGEYRLGQVGSY